MAYDEQTFRRPTGDDDDPSYRQNGHTAADYRGRRRETGEVDEPVTRHSGSAAETSRRSVDDGGEPGRDRLGIHIGWEIVLLLAVAAVGYLLYRLDPASLRRPALDTLLISATAIGLLTLGAGLTLRAGVPNLAVGPIAVASALHFAENGDKGVLSAGLPALAIAAIGGLVIALIVVGFHVPGWAATLGGGLGVIVFNQLRIAPVDVQGEYDPANQAFFLFGGFAVLAVLGGALGTLAPVRRMLGRMRPNGDPARRRTASAALPVIGSLVLSSVFAVVAGVLIAARSTGPIVPGTGLEWTGLALGLALVAGTSAYGRRGGIFGTLLAVAGMALFLDYAERRNLDIALFAIAASTVGAGLLITRLIETYGRPLPVAGPVEPDWEPEPTGAPAWTPDPPETFAPVPPQGRAWDDQRWGTTR